MKYVPYSSFSSYAAVQSVRVVVNSVLDPLYEMWDAYDHAGRTIEVSATTTASMAFEDVKTTSFSDAFDRALSFREEMDCRRVETPAAWDLNN